LSKLARNNSYVKDQYQRIEDIYALRNVFSHKNRGDYIAEVKEIAINEIEDLLKNIKDPPTVGQLFGCDVFTSTGADFIIVHRKHRYSLDLYTHFLIIAT